MEIPYEKGERFGAKGRRAGEDAFAGGGSGAKGSASASTVTPAGATGTGALLPRSKLCSSSPNGAQINIPVEKPQRIKLRIPITCACSCAGKSG